MKFFVIFLNPLTIAKPFGGAFKHVKIKELVNNRLCL